MEGRRVILIGKTGNGKSSTGNSILGADVFKSKKSSNAVTSQSAVHTREQENGRVFTVCDTPGLFCHGEDPIEMALKLQKSVKICPKPHAFLLVFSAASRMTTDEKYTVTLLRVIFGDKMFDHCIVVITRGNEFESQSEFEEFWTENDELKKIVDSCGNRVVAIENTKKCPKTFQLDQLLDMIEKLSSNGGYDHRFLKTHAEVLQEYKHTYGVLKSEDIDKHLNEILNTLEQKLEEEEERLEEEKRIAEIERKRLEEEKIKMEEKEKKREEERRKAEIERKRLEEEKRKMEEKEKKIVEERRKAEIERKRLEEEKRKMEEKEKKIVEARRKAEEAHEKRRKVEEIRMKKREQQLDEEKRRMHENEEKRNAQEEKRLKQREEELNREKNKMRQDAVIKRHEDKKYWELRQEIKAQKEKLDEQERKMNETRNECSVM